MKNETEIFASLKELSGVIDSLVGPAGCDWDKAQTPSSLTEYLLEESCELIDAIRFGETADVCEELGDVFFLLLLIAQRFEEKGTLSLADALSGVAQKMIRRHPHVFDKAEFPTLADQFRAWDAIKAKEKQERHGDAPKGLYDSVPSNVPPMTKAYRIHSKAASVGFTWPEVQDVEQQVEAEWLEVLDAMALPNSEEKKERVKHELGDHLFSLVELARRNGIKAAEALDSANNRFLERFKAMEALAQSRGLTFKDLSLDEQDSLWEEIKAGC